MATIQFKDIASTYNENLDGLYSYALHLGFDEHVVMDAIHDVFYKLCTKYSSLDEITNLKFYLFRSLRNRLIDIKRKNKELLGIPFEQQDAGYVEMPFQLYVTIEDELINREDSEEIRQKIEKVLNKLSPRQREIIYLRYIQEYTYEEIADLLQISVESCRNHVTKALVKLKESSLPILLLLLSIQG